MLREQRTDFWKAGTTHFNSFRMFALEQLAIRIWNKNSESKDTHPGCYYMHCKSWISKKKNCVGNISFFPSEVNQQLKWIQFETYTNFVLGCFWSIPKFSFSLCWCSELVNQIKCWPVTRWVEHNLQHWSGKSQASELWGFYGGSTAGVSYVGLNKHSLSKHTLNVGVLRFT